MGVVTKTETPKPHGADAKPAVTRYYDSAGRALKVLAGAGGAYTRWEYGASGLFVKQYAPVEAETGLAETFVLSVADGAGRVRGTLRELPGSAGGYSAQRFAYDNVGRRVWVYNPVEVSVSANDLPAVVGWQPAGDDAPANGGAGWVYASTQYDWKGRPLVITEPKRNPADPNEQPATREFEYGGCGCAGGEVVTERGELVPIPGTAGQGRRAQRTYSDVLGRAWKTEVLDWDGSVHSTTTNRYDALDRVVRVRQYAGAAPADEPSGEAATYQTTTMEYDGHGRLHSQRLPKYAPSTATLYEYNEDDTPKSVTDPRGVKANYSYNNSRHMPSGITYDTVEGVADTPDISFAYDAAGNRTSMADGTGSVTYEYDAFSRLTKEQRLFSGLPQHAAYETTYHYTSTGQLEYLIDPAGSRVGYDYDTTGKVRGVSGSGPASAATYASNMSYRAWGALKDVDFGNQTHQFVGYDGRLQASTMELRNVLPFSTSQTPQTMRWDYDYDADGRLDHAYDRHDDRFDRRFEYDESGRLKEAYSGREARGLAPAPTPDSPFRQTFGYDAWGNMTGRSGRFWRRTLSAEAGDYGADDRRDGWGYDAAGSLTANDSHVNTYDAAGGQTYSYSLSGGCGGYAYEIAQQYDGQGRPAHRSQTTRKSTGADPPQPQCATAVEQTFYIYAAGLGGAKLLELDAAGQKVKGYVYGGGALLAEQELYPSAPGTYNITWQHANPGSTSWVETDADRVFGRREMDPLGADVGAYDPYNVPREVSYSDIHGEEPLFVKGGDPLDLAGGCGTIDGMPASCSEIRNRMDAGTVAAEYLFHDEDRIRRLYSPIQSSGLGVFSVNVPYLRRTGTGAEGVLLYELGWQALTFSFQPQGTPHRTTDACGDMADIAQMEADQVLNTLSRGARAGVGSAAIRQELDNAVQKFDEAYSERYVGRPLRTNDDILALASEGPLGRTIPAYYFGQTGFKTRYMESRLEQVEKNYFVERIVDNDQTHHFAAMFSAGINHASWSATIHNIGDNPGDQRLTNAAYAIGALLRHDPYEGLKNIGKTIREKICDPNTRGVNTANLPGVSGGSR